MQSAPDTAHRIATALDAARDVDGAVPRVDAADLTASLEEARGTYAVALVPSAARHVLEENLTGVPGVRLNEEAAMVNVDPGFAPDIMARIGQLVGDDLEGDPGWSVSVVNENGAEYEQVERADPAPAPAVEVSLDHQVQLAAEQALEPVAGQQAMIVAIRPSTGGVLAIAQTLSLIHI